MITADPDIELTILPEISTTLPNLTAFIAPAEAKDRYVARFGYLPDPTKQGASVYVLMATHWDSKREQGPERVKAILFAKRDGQWREVSRHQAESLIPLLRNHPATTEVIRELDFYRQHPTS